MRTEKALAAISRLPAEFSSIVSVGNPSGAFRHVPSLMAKYAAFTLTRKCGRYTWMWRQFWRHATRSGDILTANGELPDSECKNLCYIVYVRALVCVYVRVFVCLLVLVCVSGGGAFKIIMRVCMRILWAHVCEMGDVFNLSIIHYRIYHNGRFSLFTKLVWHKAINAKEPVAMKHSLVVMIF